MSGPTLAQQLSHEPYPEVAAALRARTPLILKHWRAMSIEVLPHLAEESTIKEFENDIAAILDAVADSLERDDAWRIDEVLYHAPKHGVDRYAHEYPLADVLIEHRLLRSVIILELEEEMRRSLLALEEASLHAVIDVIFQSATKSHCDLVNEKLREAAKSELKLLSFLYRDLNRNLLTVTAQLEAARTKLEALPGSREIAEQLIATEDLIESTCTGMKQMLSHEQLRRSTAIPSAGPVRLRDLVKTITAPLASLAARNGVQIDIEIGDADEVETDAELLGIVLENIISNAIMHCGAARVHISGGPADEDRCRISVTDRGPGIARSRLERICKSFERGEALGTQGVGLGLAMASQAAKLLGAQIEVTTELGAGSVFNVLVPVRRDDAPEA